MLKNDVLQRSDIEDIVTRFYEVMLNDPIVGFIFTDVANIDLEQHRPIIINFWSDVVFREHNYRGHFTRWLFLFNKAVDERHAGENAQLMKSRAELVAKSISAALVKGKRGDMNLVL